VLRYKTPRSNEKSLREWCVLLCNLEKFSKTGKTRRKVENNTVRETGIFHCKLSAFVGDK